MFRFLNQTTYKIYYLLLHFTQTLISSSFIIITEKN